MIKTTIAFGGTEEQFLAFVSQLGYDGKKPSYDQDGNPAFDIEYAVDENGNDILDMAGNRIEKGRTQAFEPMSPMEFADYLILEQGLMPLIREATARIQERHGSERYDAKSKCSEMRSLISVSTSNE